VTAAPAAVRAARDTTAQHIGEQGYRKVAVNV